MNKLVKICLIAAAVIAAVGIIAVTAGMAMGARPQDFLHLQINNNGLFIGEMPFFEEDTTTGIRDGEERFAADEIHSLKMDIAGGNITIIPAEPDETDIVCLTNRSYGVCRNDNGTLVIEDDRLSNSFFFNSEDSNSINLELYIPQKAMEEIELDIGACDARIMYELEAEDLSLDIGAGSVVIDSIRVHDSADLQVGVGELVVEYYEGKDLNLDCGIGSLDIFLQGEEDDYNYNLHCGVGEIVLGGKSFSGMSWESHREEHHHKNVHKEVSADCGVGEIHIDFTD